MIATRRKYHAALLIVLLVALLLRLNHLSTQDIWFDEACSIRIANQPLANVLPTIETTENTPPLYYLILWCWKQLAGSTSPAVMRLPSVVFGTASVLALYALTRQLTRRRAPALAAAAMLAVSPFHIWYSQEARAYALMVLLGLTVTLAFDRWLRCPSRNRSIQCVLLSIALLYTHLYGGAVLLAHGLFILTRQRRKEFNEWLRWMAIAVASLLLYLPALHRWSKRTEHFWIPPNSLDDITQTLLSYFASSTAVIVFATLITIAIALMWRRRAIQLPALIFVCSVILPVAVSIAWRGMYLPRYGMIGEPALLSIVATTLFRGNSQTRFLLQLKSVISLAVAAMLIAFLIYGEAPPPRPDFRSVATYLNDHVRAGDKIAFMPKDRIVDYDYHASRPDIARYGFLNSLPFDRDLRPDEHVWLVAETEFAVGLSATIGRSKLVIKSQRRVDRFVVIELISPEARGAFAVAGLR